MSSIALCFFARSKIRPFDPKLFRGQSSWVRRGAAARGRRASASEATVPRRSKPMKTEKSATATRSQPSGTEDAALNGPFQAESYANGEVIYRPGDGADRIYLVKHGRVRLLRQGRGSQRALLAILRDGDLFGEILRPPETLMEELAVAAGPAEVWSIGSRDFRSLLESRPGL